MTTLNLDTADTMVNAALRGGRARNLKPLSVVVLDAGGHDIILKREDGSGILRVDIARGKAWGALGLGLGSRELGKRAEKNPRFFAALAAASGGRVFPNAGGVLIRNSDGVLVGAIGISGDTADMDETCALEAVTSSGLIGDGG